MSPKFRGGSDDWLDDERSVQKRTAGVRPKKVISARSVGLPWEEANATVAEVFPNQCRVRLDQDQSHLLCSYRRANVVGKSKSEIRERTPVAVGDRVQVQSTGTDTGVIEGICQRKNSISRPAPGRDNEQFHHVLAANIDLLVIVVSCREPEFSAGLVDRFLIAAEIEKVPVCICVTKLDLLDCSPSEDSRPWKIYEDLGYRVVEVISKQGQGVPELESEILGKMVVFCGQSGVGKTSLLRALLKTEVGRVGTVNEFTGKGRHTTTGAVLLEGPERSKWIDTPGVREFGLALVSPEKLSQYFPEFLKVTCQAAPCLHREEEGCEVQSLPRYSSYRRILESLLAGER